MVLLVAGETMVLMVLVSDWSIPVNPPIVAFKALS
jgi:hypothetical protein